MPIRIHINQHTIRKNRNRGENEPVISVKRGRTNTYCYSVEIGGPSTVVYRPDCPLSCGARVWIETTAPVMVDGVPLDTAAKIQRKEKGNEKKAQDV